MPPKIDSASDPLPMLLRSFFLTTMARIYPDTVEQAEAGQWSYRDFLLHLCQSEAQERAAQMRQTSAPPIVPVADKTELPLSFAQQRLWFLNQYEPDSPFYNIPRAVRLIGTLDVGALEQTFTEIVRRHEVLRTTFDAPDGRPRQLVHPPMPLALAREPVPGDSAEQRALAARRLAQAEAARPFDLQHGPLLRVRLLQLDDERHVVLLTMHHIISDGWSMGVLVNEVSTLYAAYVKGEASPLEELEVQYADFAVWQRAWLRGEALERQLAYWRAELAGAPPVLELATDRVRPAVQSYEGGVEQWEVGAELGERLREMSRREGATLFMTLLAAFKVLLYRYSGQADISVGAPIANRNRAETEKLIGFFVNTLVLRDEIWDDEPFAGLLERVRETTLNAYAHQDVPFEKLVEELQPERDLSRTPLFQVMIALQNAPLKELVLPGLRLDMIDAETDTEKFDLTLMLTETAGALRATLAYNTHLFDQVTIERMVSHFQRLLEASRRTRPSASEIYR